MHAICNRLGSKRELFIDTKFKKPLKRLGVCDKERIKSLLLSYHCMYKVKGEIDQLRDGLGALGVLNALARNASLMKSSLCPSLQLVCKDADTL